LRAAEQAPNRRVIKFSLDVPERHVDRADGEIPHSGVSAGVELPQHLMHQALVLERVLSLQERRKVVLDESRSGGMHEAAEL
jgi:hypothetical protein